MNKHFRQYLKVALNLVIALIIFLLIVLVVPRLLVFFLPFVIGWIIAAIANPPVQLLERKLKIRRKGASVIVIVLVVGVVMGCGYLLISKLVAEAMDFSSDLPELWDGVESDFISLGERWQVFYRRLPANMQDALAVISSHLNGYIGTIVERLSTPAADALGNFVVSLPTVIISVIMCLLSSYFFVAEREYLTNFFKKHLPISIQQKWLLGYGSMKKAIGGYFLAQLRIEVWMYILVVIGLMILNINYAFLFALLIAFLDLLPVFGTGTILIPWAAIKLISADYRTAVGLLILWGVGQLLRQLIQPKFIGDSIGVKPIPTLFLLFIGFRLAGIVGMILAVPIGIILITLNDAGVFDTTKNSFRLLVKKVNDFRKLDEEDLKCLKEKELEELRWQEESMRMNFSDDADDEVDWLNDNKYNEIKRELIEKLREKKEKKSGGK